MVAFRHQRFYVPNGGEWLVRRHGLRREASWFECSFCFSFSDTTTHVFGLRLVSAIEELLAPLKELPESLTTSHYGDSQIVLNFPSKPEALQSALVDR